MDSFTLSPQNVNRGYIRRKSMNRLSLVIRFGLSGVISFILGVALIFIYGFGDPPIDLIKVHSAGTQLASNIAKVAILYFIVGMGLSILWQNSRKWVANLLIGLAALHSIISIFIVIYAVVGAPNWQFLYSLTLIIPIVLNVGIIREVRKNKFQVAT
jgi:hypothetical protein